MLEMTQTVLEKMDSDEVNSISDTVESVAVAAEIRDTYRAIVSNSGDYQKTGYVQLEGLSDTKRFNQMKIPDNVVEILELWLEKPDSCLERITPVYQEPSQFVETLYQATDKPTKSVPPCGQEGPCFPVGTAEDPTCYTTFDGTTVFFNAVDTSCYDTLHSNMSAARAVLLPEFRMEDGFVPDLKVSDFSHFLQESIDACFVHFKGVSNSKAQARARNQKVSRQNNRNLVGNHNNKTVGPPYGRRSRGGSLSNLQGGGT